VWHCDAAGVYSGHPGRRAAGRPAPAPRPGSAPDEQRFLRGVQMSDAEGDVRFRTVFPGWSAGRSIHIHAGVYVGGHVTHTAQFYIDEPLARRMAALPPYRANRTARTPNAEDAHFTSGGAAGLLLVVPRDRFDLEAGLLATITVALNGGNTTVTEGSSAPPGMLE